MSPVRFQSFWVPQLHVPFKCFSLDPCLTSWWMNKSFQGEASHRNQRWDPWQGVSLSPHTCLKSCLCVASGLGGNACHAWSPSFQSKLLQRMLS